MSGMIVLIAALATTAEALPETRPYAEAYQMHRDQGKPLVVLVGAKWCPACRTMSNNALPEASQNGALRDVAFAVVDVDAQQDLAGKLMRGSSVPQLVMFYHTPAGVRRAQLTGASDAAGIARFIQQSQGQPAAAATSDATPTSWTEAVGTTVRRGTTTYSTGGS